MMSKRDEVVFVRESHDPLAVFLRHRKEVFEYISYPLSKFRGEVLEYEMWILFRDSGRLVRGNVMP